MSVRLKWIIPAPLVALLAAGCVTGANQEDTGAFLRATFDSTTGVIPTPNDLALKGAVALPAGATRAAMMSFMAAGGFPAAPPSTANTIVVPFELINDGVASAAPVWGDPATINSTTVAIVKVRGTGAPAIIDPAPATTALGKITAFPAVGYEAGARYVVAVRGGPNGVRASDGQQLVASSPVYLLTSGVDFTNPEKRPSSLTPQQAADLGALKLLLGSQADWGPITPTNAGNQPTAAAICSAALGVPAAAFPEGQCWLPMTSNALPGFPGNPATASAFAAVGLAFPLTEAISIQTFEIQ